MMISRTYIKTSEKKFAKKTPKGPLFFIESGKYTRNDLDFYEGKHLLLRQKRVNKALMNEGETAYPLI